MSFTSMAVLVWSRRKQSPSV